MRKIKFCFDYISPNAYLAWSQLPKLVSDHDLEVEIIPVLFTGLLRAHGQNGPAEQPAKSQWMSRNIARKAELLGVPLSPPRFHPFNPLLCLRISSLPLSKSQQWQIVDAFMKGTWAQGLHPGDETDVATMIANTGLDADALIEEAKSPEAKKHLEVQTQLAVDEGVFGIPSIIFSDEVFFGYDDFAYLEMTLQGCDPIEKSPQARRWIETPVTPSSVRKEMRDAKT